MRPALAGIAALVLLGGCTPLMAGFVARRVAGQQLSIERFHGRLTERHVLVGDPDGALVKDVWYQKLSKVRVEVKAPAALAGQLFVYDGAQVSMWWPSTRFGMRLKGLPAPSERDWRSLVYDQTRASLGQYRFSRAGEATIAGQSADRWVVEPRDTVPYRYAYDAWTDQQRAIPLRLTVFEAPGAPWYEMQYDAVDYDTEVPAGAFTLEFPADATVLEWDLAAEGVSPDEAQKQLDFPLQTPRALPSGYGVDKVIAEHGVLPTATLVMGDGPHWLSLTELKQSVEVVPATGKKVSVGESVGYLNFLGSYTTLSWRKNGVSLTLLSNLPHPELVAIASSVE